MGTCVSCLFRTETQDDPHREPAFSEINQDDDAVREIDCSPRRGLGSQYVKPTREQVEAEQLERDEALQAAKQLYEADKIRQQEAEALAAGAAKQSAKEKERQELVDETLSREERTATAKEKQHDLAEERIKAALQAAEERAARKQGSEQVAQDSELETGGWQEAREKYHEEVCAVTREEADGIPDGDGNSAVGGAPVQEHAAGPGGGSKKKKSKKKKR